jgi:phage shock protein PspC (stress-responsive transcriptional regulator)
MLSSSSPYDAVRVLLVMKQSALHLTWVVAYIMFAIILDWRQEKIV